MKAQLIISFQLTLSLVATCQNLIHNGDFEIDRSELNFGWEDIADSPDYINLKDESNPSNRILEGFSTNDGTSGCMGIIISNTASEVFSQTLTKALTKGKLYKLSCDVLATMRCRTGFDIVTIAFTRNELEKSNYFKNYDLATLKLKPRDGIIKHGEWTNCSVIFKANGNEQYISIGNFNLENSKYTKSIKEKQKFGPDKSCDYIIYDNVRLEEFEFKPRPMQNSLLNTDKIVLEDLFFESGKSELHVAFQYKLDSIYEKIKTPMHEICIAGYTDNIGSISDNKLLSKKRAESIKLFLVKKGYDPNKIVTKGLHESDPIMSNETEYGRSKNRRVEISFNKKETP